MLPTLAVHLFSDAEALAHAAAAFCVAVTKQAVHQRGRATIALAGGNTPRRLYTLLGQPPYRAHIPWPQVHLFWGDERAVPPDDPGSNYRLVHETLLAGLPLQAAQIHRIPAEHGAEAAARAYEEELRACFGGQPQFDLVWLGLGADGHTASLFPGSPALGETQRWVVAAPGPPPYPQRITLTLPALNAARHIAFLVTGPAKAPALARLLYGPYSPHRTPAQAIRSAHLFTDYPTWEQAQSHG